MLFGDGPKGNKFGSTSVGENNIDSSLCPTDGLVETIKVSQFGDVPLNPRNVGADCLHGLVEFLLAAACDDDAGTLSDEKLCRSQSNPICAASDDSDLAFELFGHYFSPSLLSCNNICAAPIYHRPLTPDHLSPSPAWPR